MQISKKTVHETKWVFNTDLNWDVVVTGRGRFYVHRKWIPCFSCCNIKSFVTGDRVAESESDKAVIFWRQAQGARWNMDGEVVPDVPRTHVVI